MNEQVQQIYDLYVENNLINPDNVDVEMFANANPEQLTQLYELGVDNELFRDTDQDTFMSAFNTMEVKKKRHFRLCFGSGRYGIRWGNYFYGIIATP